ncbi:MAG: thiamine phosphate synthase, partial [Deltaproteobacteria bacterium]|nr:thiamine phosphate synthase [Deltaproteobacteria bacterium]
IQGLYAIADNTFRPELTPAELALEFLRGGSGIVQLRMKPQSSFRRKPESRRLDPGLRRDDVFVMAQKIIALKKEYDFTFIINDHVDVALEIGADGVHVGADDMPVAEVRKKVGDKILIGYSSHSLKEAVAAEKAGADYVAFGAIFPTKTKGPGHPVQGLEKLRAVVEAVKIPVVAIGGINRENFGKVLETGVSSVAMITALTEASDIAKRCQQYTAGTFWLPHS